MCADERLEGQPRFIRGNGALKIDLKQGRALFLITEVVHMRHARHDHGHCSRILATRYRSLFFLNLDFNHNHTTRVVTAFEKSVRQGISDATRRSKLCINDT